MAMLSSSEQAAPAVSACRLCATAAVFLAPRMCSVFSQQGPLVRRACCGSVRCKTVIDRALGFVLSLSARHTIHHRRRVLVGCRHVICPRQGERDRYPCHPIPTQHALYLPIAYPKPSREQPVGNSGACRPTLVIPGPRLVVVITQSWKRSLDNHCMLAVIFCALL